MGDEQREREIAWAVLRSRIAMMRIPPAHLTVDEIRALHERAIGADIERRERG